MNQLIYNDLRESVPSKITFLKEHQIATLDYLFKRIKDEKKSFLVYHNMGSGKTLIALAFALFMSKEKKILILLPNLSILNNWQSHMDLALSYLPLDDYRRENMSFKTHKHFVEELSISSTSSIKKAIRINIVKGRTYEDHIFIVDEAHNFFGNEIGSKVLALAENVNINFMLLTGSPITNTASTLSDLIKFITRKEIPSKFIQTQGTKVINQSVSPECLQFVKENLKGLVSYYEQNIEADEREIPDVRFLGTAFYIFPVIICKMEPEQEQYYNNTRESMMANNQNEMFFRYLGNASLAGVGNYETYVNFKDKLESSSEFQLTPGLKLHNRMITGPWNKDLRYSSKLKYFMNHIKRETTCKHFIYFQYSTFGSVILRSILNAHGLTEYGKEPDAMALCIRCKLERKCDQCLFMKYAIVTSADQQGNPTYINEILKDFNDPTNNNGDKLMLLFGSSIITESHSLKEVREVWLLTVPDTHTQLMQTIARAVRSMSFEDLSIPVNVRILVSTTKNFRKEDYSSLMEFSKTSISNTDIDAIQTGYKTLEQINYELSFNSADEEQWIDRIEKEDIPYDIKKVLYLELKAKKGSTAITDELKLLSERYHKPPHQDLIPLYVNTKLKHYAYSHSRFRLESDDFIKAMGKILEKNVIDKHVNQMIDDRLVVVNKKFNKAILVRYETGEIITYPILPFIGNYYFSVSFYKKGFHLTLPKKSQVVEGAYIYIDHEKNVEKIKRIGSDATITTYRKDQIIELVKERFDLDLVKYLKQKKPWIKKPTTEDYRKTMIELFKEAQKKYPDQLYYKYD